MADIISFNTEPKVSLPSGYSIDVTLCSQEIEFTISGVQTDRDSRLKIAAELERIVHIIRSDVLTSV